MREWNIKGGQKCMDGIVYADCDGPVPEVNEIVLVVEKKYFEEADQKRIIAREALMKVGAALVAMGAGHLIDTLIEEPLSATDCFRGLE